MIARVEGDQNAHLAKIFDAILSNQEEPTSRQK